MLNVEVLPLLVSTFTVIALFERPENAKWTPSEAFAAVLMGATGKRTRSDSGASAMEKRPREMEP